MSCVLVRLNIPHPEKHTFLSAASTSSVTAVSASVAEHGVCFIRGDPLDGGCGHAD